MSGKARDQRRLSYYLFEAVPVFSKYSQFILIMGNGTWRISHNGVDKKIVFDNIANNL